MAHISVRLNDQLGQRLKNLAAAEHRSVNGEVIALIEEALAARANTNTNQLVNA